MVGKGNVNSLAHEAKLIADGLFGEEDVQALGAISLIDGPVALRYPPEARGIVLQPDQVAAWAAVRGIAQQTLILMHQARPTSCCDHC